MKVSVITKSIKQSFGSGLISQSQVGSFLGLQKDATREFCRGLDYYQAGRKKLYAAEDVAEKIIQDRKVSA